MNFFLTIIVTIGMICTTSGAATPTFNASTLANIGPNSFFLGSVDGKSYVVDSTTRTWAESKGFCESTGMRLGTITSAAQKTFLNSKYGSQFSGIHWTGGRDAQTVQQFVWDDSKSPVSESYINLTDIDASIQTCLACNSNASLRFHLKLCSEKAKVLCES